MVCCLRNCFFSTKTKKNTIRKQNKKAKITFNLRILHVVQRKRKCFIAYLLYFIYCLRLSTFVTFCVYRRKLFIDAYHKNNIIFVTDYNPYSSCASFVFYFTTRKIYIERVSATRPKPLFIPAIYALNNVIFRFVVPRICSR